ncbi:MAG: ABC transporter ATP-binding protein [bacterium]|nr:ABC transporter ATP-binding protein [bacterium]
MSDLVIRVEKLTKEYRLGVINHGTLHQDLQSWWAKMRGKEDPNSLISQGQHSNSLIDNAHLLALDDISFDVKEGEILGLIGPNGAGKSTLLKILSRVTAPSSGKVKIRGRIASLLEVGTGFHPELTGRENIFLNGAILGMTKGEIKKKFDEIVAFAETEKFIDTPVKRYSSGMYVRLAFAVAAHLEPEILIIDEVLAVGDAAFQKRCLGKMGDISKGGRTVLFVSHNMTAIQKLCARTILLDKGRLIIDDSSDKVLNSYLYDEEKPGELLSRKDYIDSLAPGDEYVKLRSVRLLSADNQCKSSFRMDEHFRIEITFEVLIPITNFHLYIRVFTGEGILAFCSADWDGGDMNNKHRMMGRYTSLIDIPPYLLNSGSYMLSVEGIIPSVRFVFRESSVLMWQVEASGGVGGIESVKRQGVFRPKLNWCLSE